MLAVEQPYEILPIDTLGKFNNYNSTKMYLHILSDPATRYMLTFPSKVLLLGPMQTAKNEFSKFKSLSEF